MEGEVNFSFWSDEDRWFVPRALGLGYSLNLKYLAKRLGRVKSGSTGRLLRDESAGDSDEIQTETREDRLRRQIEASRYEDGS